MHQHNIHHASLLYDSTLATNAYSSTDNDNNISSVAFDSMGCIKGCAGNYLSIIILNIERRGSYSNNIAQLLILILN